MSSIFITGITGLLGTNLAVELPAGDYDVTALVRDPLKYKGPRSNRLQLVAGSLMQDNTALLQNIDIVVHIAAETATDLTDYAAYQKVNCTATMQLFESAVKAKVKKFIFVSTANTIGFGNKAAVGTEGTPMQSPFTKLFYALSKQEAEQYLLARTTEMDVVILNPTFMLGAYDSKPSSGRIILMGLDKKIIFYPPGGKNFVHVKDAAHAIIQSFTLGHTGERYIIANENLSYKDFFRLLGKLTNAQPLLIPVPKALLLIVGAFGDALRFFKIRTSLSSVNMRALCVNTFYNSEKSRRELQVTYRSTTEAVQEAVDYFRAVKV